MPAETSIVTGIAGRYATALFDLAREAGQLDAVEADLDRIAAMMTMSADLVRLVRSPVISREEQSRALAAVLDRAGVGDLVKKFIGVVAENRRLFALRDMIRDFERLLAKHRGELAAQVVSAAPLSDAQAAELEATLAEGLGQKVKMEAVVDESLIGGLVVRIGSRMIDSSLRTKLQKLKFAMKEVG